MKKSEKNTAMSSTPELSMRVVISLCFPILILQEVREEDDDIEEPKYRKNLSIFLVTEKL